MDEGLIHVFIERFGMPISLALGHKEGFRAPLFLPARIELCRNIRVETFEGGHHLHLEGVE